MALGSKNLGVISGGPENWRFWFLVATAFQIPGEWAVGAGLPTAAEDLGGIGADGLTVQAAG